jgi:GDP/UDP-N,N'-diacetylbacillosamine 2-epimerase (hydrolysing)
VKRRICVVTGTRAEYGLLRFVMEGIRQSAALQLQVVVTGAHLSPAFGMTARDIERDGFEISRRVDMLLSSDTPVAVAKSMGLALIGFADAFDQLAPDIVLVLGDRFELLPVVSAALVAGIPVAHVHGGELSEGAIDESIRHAVTKMSHLHFVSAAEYRARVVQLGEDPDRVFLVGGLGVDAIARLELLDRSALEAALGFRFGRRNLLVTFHPETLAPAAGAEQLQELLSALDALEDTELIFTMPNADAGHRRIGEMVESFAATHPNAHVFASLGQLRYLSCMREVDGVVGNSSSGLTEAPALGKGTVNIGERQQGRLKGEGVIDCEPRRDAIAAAIAQLWSPEFQARARAARNPYGEPGASGRIVDILSTAPLDRIVRKRFYDLAGN